MKDIDFLPIRYRERSAQRRARLWRALMVCCLGGFVVAVALAQHALHRSLEGQLAAVNSRYPDAMTATARSNQLTQDVAEAEAFAALYTYLQHPWPATQLLTYIATALPDCVVISDIKLESSAAPGAVAAASSSPTTPPATTAEAAMRDLERLRSSQDTIAFTLHISGLTTDTPQFHRFVKNLAPSPLFKAAKLESLEAVKSEDRVTGSRFELRLFVRAGFGQPGGPTQPIPDSSPPSLALNRIGEIELP